MQYFILYKTTNLINNKTYIGIHQTSNLDDGYLGSGLAFKRAIKKYGKENFKREILETCNSFEELIEKEEKYVNESWINNNDNYNLKTGGQSNGMLSSISKEKISKTLKQKYAAGEIPYHGKPYVATKEIKEKISSSLRIKYQSTPHPSIGKIPWNKGLIGKQKAWNKGIKLGPMSNEQKETISKTLKELYKNTPHPRKGKSSWNKGLKLGTSPFKGVERVKTKCPYCEKMIDIANGKRWHFEKCRLK